MQILKILLSRLVYFIGIFIFKYFVDIDYKRSTLTIIRLIYNKIYEMVSVTI